MPYTSTAGGGRDGYRAVHHRPLGWRERRYTHRVWPKLARCGAKPHDCARSTFATTDLRHTVTKTAGRPDALGQPRDHLTALYDMPRGELRTELIACLRQARRSRRPSARGPDRLGTVPNMVRIHMRPPGIQDRVIAAYWEGDLI